ncbi:MAG: GNAT family N-acetyltransferase [Nocardioidaceae bacterium]
MITRPATVRRWADVVTVMGSRGDPAHCWCQFFRLRGRHWTAATRESNQEGLGVQVREGEIPPGVLAYVDGEPVGWCAVGPKSSYPRLLASPVTRPVTGAEADGTWSLTCFVVRVGWRRRGVASALLDGAVRLAREHRAARVEGYPVDRDARSSVSSAELYHGPLSVFLDAGFTEVRRPSPARPVVQLDLTRRPR